MVNARFLGPVQASPANESASHLANHAGLAEGKALNSLQTHLEVSRNSSAGGCATEKMRCCMSRSCKICDNFTSTNMASKRCRTYPNCKGLEAGFAFALTADLLQMLTLSPGARPPRTYVQKWERTAALVAAISRATLNEYITRSRH